MISQNDAVKAEMLIHLRCDIYVFLNKVCQSTYFYLKVHAFFSPIQDLRTVIQPSKYFLLDITLCLIYQLTA